MKNIAINQDVRVKKERGVDYTETLDTVMVKIDESPTIIDCDALI